MTFLDKKLLKTWNYKIPYFWSGDTIYAQSIFHSLKECDVEAKINYNRLYAHLFVFEWKSILKKMDPVAESVKQNMFNLIIILYWCLFYFSSRLINYIVRKMNPKHYYVVHSSDDIRNCVKIIDNIGRK